MHSRSRGAPCAGPREVSPTLLACPLPDSLSGGIRDSEPGESPIRGKASLHRSHGRLELVRYSVSVVLNPSMFRSPGNVPKGWFRLDSPIATAYPSPDRVRAARRPVRFAERRAASFM